MPISYDYNTGKPLASGQAQSGYNTQTGQHIGNDPNAAPGSISAKFMGSFSGSDPVVSGAAPRSNNQRTSADISGLSAAYAAQAAQIQAEKAALAQRRDATVSGIKSDFDVASKSQLADQGRSYGARSTSLITSGGGFLGATQSQEGVLQNLEGTFQTERDALMSKRESVILSAKTAYEDKDFALARELTKNATDLQKEVYQRQKDYADQTLQITSQSRAQGSYDMSLAEKKVSGYAQMSDAQFAKVSQSEINSIDSIFGVGYTENSRAFTIKAQNVKTQKDVVSLDADIMDMRLKMPAGQKFTLGGSTYTGLKTKEGRGNVFTSGNISISNADIADGASRLVRGPDGYVDPYVYMDMVNLWQSKGGLIDGFIKIYPPKNYINPAANDILPAYLQTTTTTKDKSLTDFDSL